jgi:hypothetical protein
VVAVALGAHSLADYFAAGFEAHLLVGVTKEYIKVIKRG